MNVLDAIRQATRRAGGGYTRRRGTEAFERSAENWSAVERPERVLRRMEQLGLSGDASALARSMSRGECFAGFNPLERIIGQSQLMSSFFLALGAERARAVGRIVTQARVGVGTGFLISPRLLMTNNHVLEEERVAALCRVEFDYVRRFDGDIGTTQTFSLLPGEFFLTSLSRDGLNLDYTLVAVEPVNQRGEDLARRGSISLAAGTSGDLTVMEMANIIQHPGGDPQQVALRDNKVVDSLEHFIRYEADTLPGSSGSPVFNDQWQLAALHHSGVPDEVRPGVYRLRDGGEWDTRRPLRYAEQLRMSAKVNWLSNEGVRIGSIVADARARLAGDPARLSLFEEAVREQAAPLLPRAEGAWQHLDGPPAAATPPEAAVRAGRDASRWNSAPSRTSRCREVWRCPPRLTPCGSPSLTTSLRRQRPSLSRSPSRRSNACGRCLKGALRRRRGTTTSYSTKTSRRGNPRPTSPSTRGPRPCRTSRTKVRASSGTAARRGRASGTCPTTKAPAAWRPGE
jgi:V8-like Glu-specific endopeptidase